MRGCVSETDCRENFANCSSGAISCMLRGRDAGGDCIVTDGEGERRACRTLLPIRSCISSVDCYDNWYNCEADAVACVSSSCIARAEHAWCEPRRRHTSMA